MLTKEIFNLIFPLTITQQWLTEKSSELANLLTTECIDADEQHLILDLLDNFKYLSESEFQGSIETMVKAIVNEEAYTPDNTVIVATTMDSMADSAQLVLYSMKPLFQKYGWNSPKLVNRADKIIRHFPERKNVIYVDEFVGSGQTMLGRIKNLKNQLKGENWTDYSIRVYSVAASTVGEKTLTEDGIEFFCNTIIPKGISEIFEKTKGDKLVRMARLEDILSDEYEGRPMPNLGFGKVEALYARQYGNTPNNVFPIFWWQFYKDGNSRKTLLYRSMGDA